jgi:hypothetical protein
VVEVVEGEGVSRIRAVQEVVEVEGEVEAAGFADAIGVYWKDCVIRVS